MPRIKFDDIDKFFTYHIFPSTKTMFLGSPDSTEDGGAIGVNHTLVEKVAIGLHVLDNIKLEQPINIIMNCIGGDEYEGLAIYDEIKRCSSDVRMRVTGHCMSMGVWILQAADKRILSPNSRMMVHVGSMGLGVNHPENNKAWMAQYCKDEAIFEDILLKRIREVHPLYTRQEVKDLIRFDKILMPQEAVDLGLADEIEEV